MINLKKGNTNHTSLTGPAAISSATLDTMKINMNPVTNIHLNASECAALAGESCSPGRACHPLGRAADPKGTVEVHYPDSVQGTLSTAEKLDDSIDLRNMVDELTRANEVLRLVIKLIQSNPLQINHYVIADDALLVRIIQLLCNATDVNIDADDLGQGCVTKNKYRKIHSIYVATPNGIKNLKYDFPHVMKQLKDLNISVKYVY